jgi:hypothetical protein
MAYEFVWIMGRYQELQQEDRGCKSRQMVCNGDLVSCGMDGNPVS